MYHWMIQTSEMQVICEPLIHSTGIVFCVEENNNKNNKIKVLEMLSEVADRQFDRERESRSQRVSLPMVVLLA